jgi:hypothetical protein
MNVVWKQLRDVALMELRLEFRENYFFTYRSFRSLAKASARHVGANPIKDGGLSGTSQDQLHSFSFSNMMQNNYSYTLTKWQSHYFV